MYNSGWNVDWIGKFHNLLVRFVGTRNGWHLPPAYNSSFSIFRYIAHRHTCRLVSSVCYSSVFRYTHCPNMPGCVWYPNWNGFSWMSFHRFLPRWWSICHPAHLRSNRQQTHYREFPDSFGGYDCRYMFLQRSMPETASFSVPSENRCRTRDDCYGCEQSQVFLWQVRDIHGYTVCCGNRSVVCFHSKIRWRRSTYNYPLPASYNWYRPIVRIPK